MLLFIDETENDVLFLVAGLLVDSRESATSSYRSFKKKMQNFPISKSFKKKVFNEFKSTLLDRNYQRIKTKMIEEINQLGGRIIYSCFFKGDAPFNQETKEETYISLLSKIVTSVDQDISIIFDAFNRPTFEDKIIKTMARKKNVQAIMHQNSQSEPGLQFIDNICSVLRHYKSTNEKNDWYKTLENQIKEV